MMIRDASEIHQPPAKKAMSVLTDVRVSVTDDVCIRVSDGQMAVYPLLLLDIFVDRVAICSDNDTSTAVRCNFFRMNKYTRLVSNMKIWR